MGKGDSHPPLLSDIIVPGSGADRDDVDPERILGEVLYSIRQHLGLDVAFVSEFVEGRRVFRYVDPDSPEAPIHAGESDPLEESYCQRVVDGRLPQIIRDACSLPEANALAITHRLPIGAYLSVPLRFRDGSLYGTFCCFSARPDNSLCERDLQIMRVFADYAARHLEQDIARRRSHDERLERIATVLEERRFELVYQPIVQVCNSQSVGYEVFSRFSGPPQRPPNEWFDEAGSVGLQVLLELAVIEQALPRLQALPSHCYLALNVSPETLLDERLAQLLEPQPLQRLVLEITEHVSIVDYAPLLSALAPLRDQGLAIAVDDAGAGYANFRHIFKLKPDIIKIDMSITREIDTDTEARAIAAAVIRFADEVGSSIVAEGVETQSQLEVLKQLEVGKVQGYLLAKPLPFEKLAL